MKRFFIITVLIAFVVVISGFVIANQVRSLSNPKLSDISIKAFQLEQVLTDSDSLIIKNLVNEVEGLQLVSVNCSKPVMSVGFHEEIISEEELTENFKSFGFNIKPVVYDLSNSKPCPVTGATGVLQTISNTFRF